MGGGLGGGVHAVLGHFVDAARCLLLIKAEQLVERAGAFADGVGVLDGLGDVGLREDHGFAEIYSTAELRDNGGRKCAARAVRVRTF